MPIAREAAEVLEAAEGSPYPSVPSLAAERFNRLAAPVALRFHAGPARDDAPSRLFIRPVPEVELGLHAAEGGAATDRGLTARAVLVGDLAYGYFLNPERARLRRCAWCRRWFVDGTRNRSARRCSPPCTIAFRNRQRPTKKGRAR